MTWTFEQFFEKNPPRLMQKCPRPNYTGDSLSLHGVCLTVESMKDHMTDEGWQIMKGCSPPYQLYGYGLPNGETDVRKILNKENPTVVFMQDKREWDPGLGTFREPKAAFTNYTELAKREDIFKVTVLKDAHQRPLYHQESANEIGCHAWVTYYHPKTVLRHAPYVREDSLIRTYHSVDPTHIPEFVTTRPRVGLLSGAVSGAYPLRRLLRNAIYQKILQNCEFLRHPGYHRDGCATPSFLQLLSQFKISICTSSRYAYTLRKVIESTACGCMVLTDLPEEERLPEIDGNLYRIRPDTPLKNINSYIQILAAQWNPEIQYEWAMRARQRYNYRGQCSRILGDIERMRRNYNGGLCEDRDMGGQEQHSGVSDTKQLS